MGKHNSEPKTIDTIKDTARNSEGAEELLWGCSDQNSQQEAKSVVQNQKRLVFLVEKNFPPKESSPPPLSSLHTAVFLKLAQLQASEYWKTDSGYFILYEVTSIMLTIKTSYL